MRDDFKGCELVQDTQGLPDSRGVQLDQVGVRDLHYPITIMDRLKAKQQTTACFNLAVSLPPEQRGTHMSRPKTGLVLSFQV